MMNSSHRMTFRLTHAKPSAGGSGTSKLSTSLDSDPVQAPPSSASTALDLNALKFMCIHLRFESKDSPSKSLIIFTRGSPSVALASIFPYDQGYLMLHRTLIQDQPLAAFEHDVFFDPLKPFERCHLAVTLLSSFHSKTEQPILDAELKLIQGLQDQGLLLQSLEAPMGIPMDSLYDFMPATASHQALFYDLYQWSHQQLEKWVLTESLKEIPASAPVTPKVRSL